MILDVLQGEIPNLLSGRVSSLPDLRREVARLSIVASARAAVDLALYDLQCNLEGTTLPPLLGSKMTSVGTDITVPIAELSDIPQLIASRLGDGFNTFKIKLGIETIEKSVSKLELVRDLVGESALLRIDPNQAWSIGHTLAFLRNIDGLGIDIDYLEQPTPAGDKSALAEIRRNSQVRVMADEACFDMADLQELIDLDAVDLVNIKLLKCGGLTSAIEMGELATAAGVGILVGSMMEGDRGLFAAACLASALAPDEIHDLDASWWAEDSTIEYSVGRVSLT
jgi:L-alanine-DL-glutamate epimerase-like enolase superfamily enzyme